MPRLNVALHGKTRGVALLIAALLVLPGMDAIAKALSSRLPVLEVTWGRFLVYSIWIVPIAFQRHGFRALQGRETMLQVLRGLLLLGSAVLFFYSISRIPLADAMALFFVYPFLMLIFAMLILRERVRPMQWACSALGFLGALLVLHPTHSGISLGGLMALGTAAFYGAALMLTRVLASRTPSLVTAAVSALVGLLALSLVAPMVWQSPSPSDWLLLVAMGTIAAIGHWLIVLAHHYATAVDLAPFGYTEILMAVILSRLIFGDVPPLMTRFGIVLIVCSGSAAAVLTARGSAVNGRWRANSASPGVSSPP